MNSKQRRKARRQLARSLDSISSSLQRLEGTLQEGRDTCERLLEMGRVGEMTPYCMECGSRDIEPVDEQPDAYYVLYQCKACGQLAEWEMGFSMHSAEDETE